MLHLLELGRISKTHPPTVSVLRDLIDLLKLYFFKSKWTFLEYLFILLGYSLSGP